MLKHLRDKFETKHNLPPLNVNILCCSKVDQIHELAVEIGEKVAKAESLGNPCYIPLDTA